MENNSPECIAKNVVRALKYPHIDMIIENQCKLVNQEFTFESAVDKYKRILTIFEKHN